jgi:hypothetical protein
MMEKLSGIWSKMTDRLLKQAQAYTCGLPISMMDGFEGHKKSDAARIAASLFGNARGRRVKSGIVRFG